MFDGPTIVVRFALYLVLAALFGLSAFSLYGLRADEREDAIALRPW
ncbi:copper resistance protein CopD, partial [Streptomyces sp. WAC04770]